MPTRNTHDTMHSVALLRGICLPCCCTCSNTLSPRPQRDPFLIACIQTDNVTSSIPPSPTDVERNSKRKRAGSVYRHGRRSLNEDDSAFLMPTALIMQVFNHKSNASSLRFRGVDRVRSSIVRNSIRRERRRPTALRWLSAWPSPNSRSARVRWQRHKSTTAIGGQCGAIRRW